jgi:uncharacterized membrane protein YheB (UPF0754 family)
VKKLVSYFANTHWNAQMIHTEKQLARICEEENNVKKWVSYFVHKNCKTDHDCQCNLLRICEEENNVKKWVSCFVHENWKCTDHD